MAELGTLNVTIRLRGVVRFRFWLWVAKRGLKGARDVMSAEVVS
jgi:hypothetical protein